MLKKTGAGSRTPASGAGIGCNDVTGREGEHGQDVKIGPGDHGRGRHRETS
ncbi:MAG TPA: hypothetical protein PKO38_01265 [Bacillota bacterium]|nr:hypothetical protein [Bacillota bacterium]HOB86301.1 hypothetical protein [Bacillota bacterium]HOP69618.1 hypothetical protein [Bacillota bacterium]HPT34695.1 hypothetical protein [Bacillota bacterium]HQD06273.1 hypothetical protein [Bacillota bacterium]